MEHDNRSPGSLCNPTWHPFTQHTYEHSRHTQIDTHSLWSKMISVNINIFPSAKCGTTKTFLCVLYLFAIVFLFHFVGGIYVVKENAKNAITQNNNNFKVLIDLWVRIWTVQNRELIWAYGVPTVGAEMAVVASLEPQVWALDSCCWIQKCHAQSHVWHLICRLTWLN